MFCNSSGLFCRPSGNVSVGAWSLWRYGKCSSCSTAIGSFSQYDSCGNATSSPGIYNTSIGYGSLRNIGAGTAGGMCNTVAGYFSGSELRASCANTFLGTYSGYYSTNSANCNVAIGFRALVNNTTGFNNTSIGTWSLWCNKTGTRNVAIGREALNCTNSACVIGIGTWSLYNSVGIENLAIGHYALSANTTGNYNVGIGNWSMGKNSVGCCNTIIGYHGGINLTNGTCNTGVGYRALSGITSAFNTIGIGWCASPSNTNHHTVWGNSSNNVCNCVFSAWANVSDERDKTDITSLDSKYGVEFIQCLNPVKYRWDHRETYQRECGYKYGEKDSSLKSDKLHYGFIAQDVKRAIEDLGIDFDGLGYDEIKDAYRLTYEELLAPIVKTIQELINKNKKLKQDLRTTFDYLKIN